MRIWRVRASGEGRVWAVRLGENSGYVQAFDDAFVDCPKQAGIPFSRRTCIYVGVCGVILERGECGGQAALIPEWVGSL